MDYRITYILPEAIEWLTNNNFDFTILPYDEITLQVVENHDYYGNGAFANFMYSKQKLIRSKQQQKSQFKYSFNIRARQANSLNFKEVFANISSANWYMLPNKDTPGNITFLFKDQQDCNLFRLLIA